MDSVALAASGGTAASDIQMNYMKLLITQLQNQNPLEPMDNNQMASQLAQFSELQQIESMNTNFAKVLATVESQYGSGLVGKDVTFLAQSEEGNTVALNGKVEAFYREDGKSYVVVGDYVVGLEDVVAVRS